PAAAQRSSGLRAVPLYNLFASEENSARSAPIAARAPQNTAAFGAADAQRLGLAEGATATLNVNGRTLQLPVRISAGLSAGCVGLVAGAQGTPLFNSGELVVVEAHA